MISVRQTRDLPRASFRFRIATDTLAFSYVLTANGHTQDFHLLEFAHAGRTKKANPTRNRVGFCAIHTRNLHISHPDYIMQGNNRQYQRSNPLRSREPIPNGARLCFGEG